MANSWSSRDRYLENAAAMLLPPVMIKAGKAENGLAGAILGSSAAEGLMNATSVVIDPELFQLSLQIE